MAYVIVVAFRKPEQVAAFVGLIDRHAQISRMLQHGCVAFDVCQDPDYPARFVFYEAHRRRRRTASISRWTATIRSNAPDLVASYPAPKAPCPTTARCWRAARTGQSSLTKAAMIATAAASIPPVRMVN